LARAAGVEGYINKADDSRSSAHLGLIIGWGSWESWEEPGKNLGMGSVDLTCYREVSLRATLSRGYTSTALF
jgi:hypothetical protein